MKVVLFCGGLGMRLRDYCETIPKPMVNFVLSWGGKCHRSYGNGTFKDKQQLENLWGSGTAPWEVGKANRTKPSLSKAVVSSETPCIP
jgi:hypothetical protein